MLWPGDLRGNAEGAVEVLDLRFGGCGLADAQGRTVIDWQDDGADLVALEGVAQRRPGGVDAMVEERLLDRDQQMVGRRGRYGLRCGARCGGRSAVRRAAISCRGRRSRHG